jgi:hypothetical protein
MNFIFKLAVVIVLLCIVILGLLNISRELIRPPMLFMGGDYDDED